MPRPRKMVTSRTARGSPCNAGVFRSAPSASLWAACDGEEPAALASSEGGRSPGSGSLRCDLALTSSIASLALSMTAANFSLRSSMNLPAIAPSVPNSVGFFFAGTTSTGTGGSEPSASPPGAASDAFFSSSAPVAPSCFFSGPCFLFFSGDLPSRAARREKRFVLGWAGSLFVGAGSEALSGDPAAAGAAAAASAAAAAAGASFFSGGGLGPLYASPQEKKTMESGLMSAVALIGTPCSA
mmetsp:Transcript_2452/g.4666  ORF Transcript_2452/g.4666 Transcript_2452/m.4666 type:complete len:241 (+) Transcript_2452:153-875(+)